MTTMDHDFDTHWLAPVRARALALTNPLDPAHDFQHVLRVAANARRIAAAEGGDVAVCVTAALLHEIVNLPKDHPESSRSGELCAERAIEVLGEIGFPRDAVERVAYAIRVHGFSRGIVPETLDAKILQDADRLDAIGAIGIARCFATCASMQRPFYSPDDPMCETRELDDKRWGVDHFFRKLLRIHEGLHTITARELGAARAAFMRTYLEALKGEIEAGGAGGTRG